MSMVKTGLDILGFFWGKKSAKADLEWQLYKVFLARGYQYDTAASAAAAALAVWKAGQNPKDVEQIKKEAQDEWGINDEGGG